MVACVQAAGLGIWNVDLSGPPAITWDKRCRELFGIAKGNTLTYEKAIGAIHDDDLEAARTAFENALDPAKTGEEDGVYRIIGVDDGHLRWIRLIGKAHFTPQGIASRLSGIAMEVTADVIAREKAAQAENLTEIVVKGTGIGTFSVNLLTDELEYSPAFSIILTGKVVRDLSRQEFIKRIHPEDLHLRSAAYEAARNTGDLFYESRTVWYDGTIRTIRTVGKYLFDAGGNPVSFTGTVQDVTDEREREKALREAEERHTVALHKSESRFRNITNTAPTGLWMIDEQGQITYLNKTMSDWTGEPHDVLLRMGWAGFVLEEDRERTISAFTKAAERRQHFDVEFRIRKRDSEVIWCRGAGEPYYHDDGRYAGYVGYCMDIHDKVVSANRLKLSEERMRAIIEQAPLAIGLFTGRDMVIETANESILALWNKDKTIIGKPLAAALPELNPQPFISLMQHTYDSGQPYYALERAVLIERDGKPEERFFDFVYHPLRAINGEVMGVMLVATEVTAKVIARKSVEDSEQHLRTLIGEAPFATALYQGRQLIIETANEAMIRLWGKDKSVVGKPLRVALPELEGQPFFQILDDIFNTGETYHAESGKAELVVGGKLTAFYFNFTYKPLRNKEGQVYAILNMAVDITEQVLARKKVEESDLFARNVIENSPVAKSVFIGNDLVVKTANEKMLQIMGSDASVLGRPLTEALPHLQSTVLPEKLREVLRTGETYYSPEQKIVTTQEGRPHVSYYNFIYKSFLDTEGKLFGIICTATEVTDMVLNRQKIEEAEASLRSAIELAELGTWEIDLSTMIINYSERLRSWCGFAPDEIITVEKSDSVIVESDRILLREAMSRALTPGINGIYNVEYHIRNKITGVERILHAQGKVFLDKTGLPFKVSGTAQDVTKQRQEQFALEQEVHARTEELQILNKQLQVTNDELFQSNERLARSNEELEQYAFVTSHDLQEPLRKITTFSGMLDKQADLPEESRALLGKVIQSAQRMSMLIRDLLEFSRLMKSDMVMQPVDLRDICQAILNDFELSIREKRAEIEIGDLPVIEAVSLQMNQLFYNLIGNALKFVSPGTAPHIRISCRVLAEEELKQHTHRLNLECGYYKITFTDNGIGFDAAYAEQIFEVFKRLHGRSKYPGSGIGLALCKRIVANHKGYLYAESTPGQGSHFHVILPDKTVKC